MTTLAITTDCKGKRFPMYFQTILFQNVRHILERISRNKLPFIKSPKSWSVE